MRYRATSCFSADRLNLPGIEHIDRSKLIRKESSFRLYRIDDHQYIYVKDYGGVAFIGLEDDAVLTYKEALAREAGARWTEHTEHITLRIKTPDESVNVEFDTLLVESLDDDTAHIVALNLAQSVALEYYQSLAQGLLEETHVHTTSLEKKGALSMRRKKLLKYLGASLNLKNKISENLYVFETPVFSWDNEEVNKIDRMLNEELEIRLRYEGVIDQLSIVEDNLNLFKDLNMHDHSSRLEWIIIYLILFEVVHVIIDKLM